VEPVRACVVGIMGSGRSGSTLLEFLLAGYLDGARPLGELETLSIRGLRDNELCSCARHAMDCEAWKNVLGRLADDANRKQWETLVESRWHRLPWALGVWGAAAGGRLLGQRPNAASPKLRGYAPVLSVLSELTPAAGPLIDNSKTPLHFFALAATEEVDLRVVHLVRHPHAVVWSWKRRKRLPESGSLNWYMEPKSALVSATRWMFDQLVAASFRHLHPELPYVRVSYDDLCAAPGEVLTRCAASLHVRPAVVSGRPSSYHVLGGNPARFSGFSDVKADNEWQTKLPWSIRISLSITALPLYRLLLRGSGGSVA
jgi:hypothetical protein